MPTTTFFCRCLTASTLITCWKKHSRSFLVLATQGSQWASTYFVDYLYIIPGWKSMQVGISLTTQLSTVLSLHSQLSNSFGFETSITLLTAQFPLSSNNCKRQRWWIRWKLSVHWLQERFYKKSSPPWPHDREVQQSEGYQREAAAAATAPHHNPRCPGGSRRAGHC